MAKVETSTAYRLVECAGGRHLPDMQSHSVSTRLSYVALAAATIAVGLGVHRYGEALGPVWRDVAGDALYATMVTWWVSAIAPHLSLLARSALAIAICFAIEASQLLHTPALDSLRRTTIGRLTLGTGFDPRDLLSYTVGVLAAAILERAVRHWLGRGSHPATV